MDVGTSRENDIKAILKMKFKDKCNCNIDNSFT
jgi:hypothetical protein